MSGKNFGKDGKQRDIADFFKPFAKTTVPAKRPSPSPDPSPVPPKKVSPSPDLSDDDEFEFTSMRKASRRPEYRTPNAPRFKNVSSNPTKSPIPFKTQVNLPLGSPRPKSAQRQNTFPSSSLSNLGATPSVSSSFDFPSIASRSETAEKPLPSAPASSKKVLLHGKVIAVKDSDEEGFESDSSLEELDDILGALKDGSPSSSSSPPDPNDFLNEFLPTRQPRVQDRTPILGKALLNATKMKVPKHKFTLDNILAQHLGDQSTEQTVAQTRNHYEEGQLRRKAEGSKDSAKTLLESVLTGEEDNGPSGAARLMGAVERTEAIGLDRSWSLFNSGSPQIDRALAPSFPDSRGFRDPLTSILGNEAARKRAFLSGYIAEIWSKEGASPDCVIWLLESIIYESREDLRSSYLLTVGHLPAGLVHDSVTPSLLEQLFIELGARDEAVQLDTSIRPTYMSKSNTEGTSQPLKALVHLIKALTCVAKSFSVESRQLFASILLRLMVDRQSMAGVSVSTAVEDCLSEIVESCPPVEAEQLCDYLHSNITQSLHDIIFQKLLLSHIQPSCVPLGRLRLCLAQSFLFSSAEEPIPKTKTRTVTSLLDHLSSPLYTSLLNLAPSDQHTYDFSLLSSQLYFLSVLINSTLDLPLLLSEPKVFNTQIDNLLEKLKQLFSAISDTGASHMMRTEVKEQLEALMVRLEYTIRTKPRPRRGIWSTSSSTNYGPEVESGQNMMKNFLARRMENKGKEEQVLKKSAAEADVAEERISETPPVKTANFSSSEGAIRQQLGLDLY